MRLLIALLFALSAFGQYFPPVGSNGVGASIANTSNVLCGDGSGNGISCGLASTSITKKFTGAGVPGSVTGSTRGDVYTDTTNGNTYQCFGAGPCTAVAAGNWQQVNLDSTKIPTSYLDTDGTLAANSDTAVASQKATKTYADTKAALNATATINGTTCTLGLSCSPVALIPITISTSGPVTDPGGNAAYLYNNAAGALTFNLPAGVAGKQRCYRQATGKSDVITIAVTTGNSIDLNGANGTTTTGTLVSTGAPGESVCLVSDAANHWYATVLSGTWTNN